MSIKHTPFRANKVGSSEDNKPLVVRLNDKEKEMIEIAKYALNNDSAGGVLKVLAEWGFKNVILGSLGVDYLHYLTSGERVRVIRNKPDIKHWAREL